MIVIQRAPYRGISPQPDLRSVIHEHVRDIISGLAPSNVRHIATATGHAMVSHFAVGEERFRVAVDVLRGDDGGIVPFATVERTEAAVVSQTSVPERYRLTEKETRVALLLAQRRSNAEIAAALRISPHTARRHTENVMLKLNVNSRFSVESVLRAVA